MRTILPIILAVSLVSGCATKTPTEQHYYPSCQRPIQQLREMKHEETTTTLGGTAIGAISGALLGYLLTGRSSGAIVGGMGGAVTGTIMGRSKAKEERMREENRRMSYYLDELDGDIRDLDFVHVSARVSLQCYDERFQNLLSAIRSRKIFRHEAEERFEEIARGRDEAITLLGEAVTRGRDLDQQYEKAFEQEEESRRKALKPRADEETSRPAYEKARASRKKMRDMVDEISVQHEDARKQSTMNRKEFEKRLEEIDL